MTETQVIPGSITVRYWAGAKHAAGTDRDELETDTALTLAEVRGRAVALHPGTRLGEVLGACSALVGEQPVGKADPASVEVRPGETVEFLPPFAGG
jgi:molybdopterin converting factor small subunit